MGRIRILPDQVANQIAAGEVVERPSSVVKELLENSFDAGATQVRIEVEAGGRRLIRVADNGSGMLRDDALLAFERHATSKLSDIKDLLAISTLGFRGEALPSIASVSRLVLETRSDEEHTGSRVEVAGGKILRCDEAALAPGTAVTVRDLFFNVPARRKFLRSEPTELAHIAAVATHYSLARPAIALELLHSGAELLSVTPVDGLRDRIFQVFGAQILNELIDLGGKEAEIALPEEAARRFRLRGFVSQPQFQRPNRNSIYLFVNGRLIRDKTLLHALSSAYQNLMPGSAFPLALLFLECDPGEVDVNVHPSKTEVRFRRASFVHDFVREAIREALLGARPVPSVPPGAVAQPGARLPYSEFTQQVENREFWAPPSEALASAPGARVDERWPAMAPGGAAEDAGLPEFTLHRPSPVRTTGRLDFGEPLPPPAPGAPAPARIPRVPETHGPPPGLGYAEVVETLDALADLRPVGQLHDSFIVAAGRDGLWIIDQHVAHERVLFERTLRQMAAGRVERQSLLVPILVELTAAQQADYGRLASDLESAGFEIEPFGPRTIAVKAAPALLGAGDIEKVILEILEIPEVELRGVSLEDVRRQLAASIACRAAIKINTPLEIEKMGWLLRELAATEYPMSCPHGRPIALRYATREILKGFHRI